MKENYKKNKTILCINQLLIKSHKKFKEILMIYSLENKIKSRNRIYKES